MLKKKQMEEEALKPEVSEKELDSVKDVLRAVTKAIKTFNAYPRDNPIYQKTADDLFGKFHAFLEAMGELEFDVDQYSFFYKGKEVYRFEEKTENIAVILYADGIRKLSFQKELTPEELFSFIEILRLAPKTAASDSDDVVTLLWEKNIRNMGYSVVEDTIEDELVVEESLFQEGAGEQAEGGGTTLHGASYSSLTVKPMSLQIKTEPLTSEELEAAREELLAIDEKSLLSSAVGLFFSVLSEERDVEAFSDMAVNLGRIVDMRLGSGDVKGAIDVLRMLRKISVISGAPEQVEVIDKVFVGAGDTPKIRSLFKGAENSADIKQYLLLLDKGAISGMVEVLGELGDRKMRRLLCDALAEIGRQDVDAFDGAMRDERWFVVRNITLVLGMTKEPKALKYLERALRHPEVKVRREAVKAIESIGSEETKRLFLAALKDPDPAVRIGSYRALRRLGGVDVFHIIKSYASREALKGRSFTEKREILETIAVLGREEALPLLSDLFKKKGFIEKDDSVEIRAATAYGLGLIRSPGAKELLRKEAKSRKSLLRDACEKALKGR